SMVRRRTRRHHVVIALTIAFLCPRVLRALTDEETFREFRFNFGNPGARALGMGGAFAAIADDATAAQPNPAGLQFVLAPQFLVEYRSLDRHPTMHRGSRASLAVHPGTGARDLPFLGLTTVSNPDTTGDVGFVGVVIPVRRTIAGRRVRFEASRQVILSEDRSLSSGGDATEARFSFPSFPNTV